MGKRSLACWALPIWSIMHNGCMILSPPSKIIGYLNLRLEGKFWSASSSALLFNKDFKADKNTGVRGVESGYWQVYFLFKIVMISMKVRDILLRENWSLPRSNLSIQGLRLSKNWKQPGLIAVQSWAGLAGASRCACQSTKCSYFLLNIASKVIFIRIRLSIYKNL